MWCESELQFRRLLERLPVGAYTCDAEGFITYFNPQAVQLWGRAPKLNDPVDRYCGSFRLFSVDGTPIQHDQCWMARALQTGSDYNGQEIVIERPDGRRITALAHANPLYDDSGQLIGAVNVLVDVSDRKRAEDVQLLLAAIVESSDDAIVSKSLDGQILSWNPGAERLFAYTAKEAIGAPITLIIPPERREEEQMILTRLRSGERIDHFETVRVDKAGRRIDVSLSVSPIRDSAGRIIGASKVARDVSERKRIERDLVALKDQLATQLADVQRLREMSARLSTTLELEPILNETLRTAMAIEGADMGLLSLCDAEGQQLQVGASSGLDAAFLQAVERVPCGCGACGTCLKERRRVIVEDVTKDPKFAPYREAARRAGFRAIHSTPLMTRSGEIVGVLTTHFRDVHRPTDREIHLTDLCARQAVDFIENARLYAELREADRRKDEFLATLAHELRNPLAPLSNSLHLLRLSDDLSPALARIRDIMEQQVNHMVRLVDDLLEVSRITRGKVELRKEEVDLTAVVCNAVETSRPLIDSAGHQLAISLPPDPMVLEADPVRLAQVIGNLLTNAAKYTEPGGQIWLTARQEHGEAVVSVRDTGLGIPGEMLPQIFEMFAQVDQTLSRAQGGLGIGLTLAKSLVQMHGGHIEAHSDGPGRGSEFIVRLPLTATSPTTTVRTSIAPVDRVKLPRHRIVVVDDTRAAAFTLGRLLEAMGQHVRIANDAVDAFHLICSEQPDLVITDIAMPKMNGYELARRLRERPELQNLILVALTGYGQDSDRQQSKAAGFDEHLVKPVSLQALHELLTRLPRPADVSHENTLTPERLDIPSSGR